MLASATPSPAANVRPVIPFNVTVPLGAQSVSSIGLAAESTAVTEIELPFVVEKMMETSSVPATAAGIHATGTSDTGRMLSVTRPVAKRLPSKAVKVNVSAPLEFVAGRYVTVPLLELNEMSVPLVGP